VYGRPAGLGPVQTEAVPRDAVTGIFLGASPGLWSGGFGAYRARVFAESEHGVGEQRATVFGYEHQVRVQQRHAVSGTPVGLGCQWWALRCGCAGG
jgi:hypothetical protein